MIPVNCGAIPPQLIESTLFGHERGAFTGATTRSKGIFEAADGGTVLLDEIGELPAAAQAALLRVLETKRISRVGSTREIEVDLRVLAATHRDLEAMCDEGTFRRDLLFRLDAMALRIPPLRHRPEDLAPLYRRFATQAARANDVPTPGITEDAMELLRRHSWPGNVRELRNAVERATVIAQGALIDVDDLPERVRSLDTATGYAVYGDVDEDLAALQPVFDRDELNLKAEVQRFEVLLIRKALERHNWDRKPAATALGLPLRTLAHKVQIYDIRR